MKDNKLPKGSWGLCPLCGRPLHPGALPPLNTNGFISLNNPELYPHPPLDQVEVARIWIKKFCRHSVKINRKNSSYFLKHSIEDWDRATANQKGYISNGAVIQAFLEEGYICEVYGLNGCFHFEYLGPKVKGYYKGARARIPFSVPDWENALSHEVGCEAGQVGHGGTILNKRDQDLRSDKP